MAVNLSERVGAARPRRPTGDGLGQDVPATVKNQARCPRSRVESGFISDLGLSTFGPSALHFQNLSVLVFQLLPDGVGQMLVQAEDFRKKFRFPAYSAFACAVKAREMRGFKVQVGRQEEEGGKQLIPRLLQNMERDAPWTAWSKMPQPQENHAVSARPRYLKRRSLPRPSTLDF